MSKVLISFLGTGSLDRSAPKRTYNTVNYHLGNVELGKYSFMSAALKNHYAIDKVLLVGTVHSMWEEVYSWYSNYKQMPIDDDVYLEIADTCEKSNYTSPLFIPHKEAIEEALGKGSKVILIKYGINEDEIKENINIILGLHQYLDSEDELIVDVTHSFRSLPLFMMNLIVYLQNVSTKSIKISHIHYGMLEINREIGYAPIIDLRSMLDVNDWITGAYAFSMFGNTYKISKLLENENKSVAPILKGFSDAMNLNYLYPMQAEAQKLSGIKNKDYKTDLPKLIINPVVEDYVKTFLVRDQLHEQSFFQLKLADWQFKHKKYGQAYLTSNDALITYICELNGFTWKQKSGRDRAKEILQKKREGHCTPEMEDWFNNHNERRNGIAHTVRLKNKTTGKDLSNKEIIHLLEVDIEELKQIFGLL